MPAHGQGQARTSSGAGNSGGVESRSQVHPNQKIEPTRLSFSVLGCSDDCRNATNAQQCCPAA
eukprot:357091-Chlamydomonas_euryale.AAC.3